MHLAQKLHFKTLKLGKEEDRSQQATVIGYQKRGLLNTQELEFWDSGMLEFWNDGREERGAWSLRQKRETLAGKSKIIALTFALALAFVSAGCATDKVAVDLTTYVNQGVLRISELEEKALARYASVTGKNYTSDEKAREALKTSVIPLYGRFLRELRTIRPQTDEVKNLHRMYISGAESLLEGFKLIMYAIEAQDTAMIRAANQNLENGRQEQEQWKKEIAALGKEHSVKLVGKEESGKSVMDILLGAP